MLFDLFSTLIDRCLLESCNMHFLLQAKETNGQSMDSTASPKKPLLGAFGSIIPDAPEKQAQAIGNQKAWANESNPSQLGDLLNSGVSGKLSATIQLQIHMFILVIYLHNA